MTISSSYPNARPLPATAAPPPDIPAAAPPLQCHPGRSPPSPRPQRYPHPVIPAAALPPPCHPGRSAAKSRDLQRQEHPQCRRPRIAAEGPAVAGRPARKAGFLHNTQNEKEPPQHPCPGGSFGNVRVPATETSTSSRGFQPRRRKLASGPCPPVSGRFSWSQGPTQSRPYQFPLSRIPGLRAPSPGRDTRATPPGSWPGRIPATSSSCSPHPFIPATALLLPCHPGRSATTTTSSRPQHHPTPSSRP